MKKAYLISFITAFSIVLKAQQPMLTPTVIASTGGFSSNANNSLSYTVGEMTMVQTFSSPSNILTQGFQQPNEQITGLLDVVQDDYGSFVIYPNPAIDYFAFGFMLPDAGKVTISLYDALGQKLADLYEMNYDNGKIIEQANINNLSSGLYVVTMTFVSSQDSKTHITSKKLQVLR